MIAINIFLTSLNPFFRCWLNLNYGSGTDYTILLAKKVEKRLRCLWMFGCLFSADFLFRISQPLVQIFLQVMHRRHGSSSDPWQLITSYHSPFWSAGTCYVYVGKRMALYSFSKSSHKIKNVWWLLKVSCWKQTGYWFSVLLAGKKKIKNLPSLYL